MYRIRVHQLIQVTSIVLCLQPSLVYETPSYDLLFVQMLLCGAIERFRVRSCYAHLVTIPQAPFQTLQQNFHMN